MCGILGMITTNKSGYYQRDADAFKAMMVLTSLRGQHSTGVFGVNRFEATAKASRVSMVKCVGNPYNLFGGADSEEFFNRVGRNMGLVVGHCRYATRGAVNAQNAHPFREGDITLVHNGVISNFNELHEKDKHKDITVDSHLVTKLIADHGADNILPYIQGAYVLVWYDNSDRTLHIARNHQRPLFFAAMEGGNNVFASEKETLIWNAQRHNYKINDLFEIPTFKHLIFGMGEGEPREVIPYTQTFYLPRHLRKPHREVKAEPKENLPVKAGEPEKGTVVPFRGETKRFRTKKADDAQLRVLNLVEQTNEVVLERDDRIDLFLRDIDRNSSRTLLTLYHDNFPAVEFGAIIRDGFTDDQILEFDFIRGNISSMYNCDLSDSKTSVPWKFFLNQCVGVKKLAGGGGYITYPLQNAKPDAGADDDLLEPAELVKQNDDQDDAEFASLELPFREFVVVPDTLGTNTRLNNDTYLKAASEGCQWCTTPLTTHEIANPEKLLYWRDKNEYGLVCPSCAAAYHRSTSPMAD